VPVSVNCTAAGVVDRLSVMLGSAGRYMSMVSGPMAMSEPSTSTSRTRCRRFIRSPGIGVWVTLSIKEQDGVG